MTGTTRSNIVKKAEDAVTVKDANGTLLSEGDKVTMIKDLKVKGSSLVLKVGTKAVIKRLKEGKDHQLDCKIDNKQRRHSSIGMISPEAFEARMIA